MALQTTIPLLGGKADAKDLVITILSSQWPLNARELFFVARNKFGSKLSYQAIHKALLQLHEEDVVNKAGKNYSLSQEWLGQVTQFAKETNVAYEKNSSREVGGETNEATLVFYNPIKALYKLLDLMHKEFLKQKPEYAVSITRRAWPVICCEKKHFKKLELIVKSCKDYKIVQEKSRIDNFLMGFFKQLGAHYKLGVRGCAKDCDYLVFNDFVVKIFFPKTYSEKLDSFYKKNKEINEKNTQELYDIAYNSNGETIAKVTKNKQLADEIIKRVLKEFGEKP